MKTKIPPPIIALLMIGLVYLSSLLIGSVSFDYQASLSVFLVIVGLSCACRLLDFLPVKKQLSARLLLLRPLYC